jgi:hypothetical protein
MTIPKSTLRLLVMMGVTFNASAAPIQTLEIFNTYEGVLSKIVDNEDRLDHKIQINDLLHGGFSYTATNIPDWTNVNPSDPGPTLVQLFAFLGESILYRTSMTPESGRLSSLIFELTKSLFIVEPCGGYLSSSLTLPFETCLRLKFFKSAGSSISLKTSIFDLGQWDTIQFYWYPMELMSAPLERFDESVDSNFLVSGYLTQTMTMVRTIPKPNTFFSVGILRNRIGYSVRITANKSDK